MSSPPTDEELRTWEHTPPRNLTTAYRTELCLISEVRDLRAELAAVRLALAHERSQPSTGDREQARRYRAALKAVVDAEAREASGGAVDDVNADINHALSVARDLLAADVTGFDAEGREVRGGEEQGLPEAVMRLRAGLEPFTTDEWGLDTVRGHNIYPADVPIILEWLRTARLGGQRAEWVAGRPPEVQELPRDLFLYALAYTPSRTPRVTVERPYDWPSDATHWQPLPPAPALPAPASCKRCHGDGTVVIFDGPGATNPRHVDCDACSGTTEER